MSKHYFLFLLLSGLVLSLIAASFQKAPGYMDADYYYSGGLRIHQGQGHAEPYIWNFLNAPERLPAPAFAYWMPLTSYITAAGLWILPSSGFWGARVFFILLAALVPLLTAQLALKLTGNPAHARLAGLLALFPGFYFAFQTTTDAFPVYMVIGGLYLLAAFERDSDEARHWLPEVRLFFLGLLAGLLHLARADGILWIGATLAVGAVWFLWTGRKAARLMWFWAASLVGYGLVMLPWYVRNLAVWGSPLPPGGSRAIWITAYEQTMLYPASQLTLQHWLAAGWSAHLLARGEALLQNAQTALAVQGGIILFPFILAGLWALRHRPEVRFGAAIWLANFVMMTLVFPFAGPNGSFFHSGAATQVLFWAVAPVGIAHVMARYARWRRLPGPEKITRFATILALGVMVLITLGIYGQRMFGEQPEEYSWNGRERHYRQVEQFLLEAGIKPEAAVLVNNPPGYWATAGRPAVVIPYGDEAMLLAVAARFDIDYLVLEAQNPIQLSALYHGQSSYPEFELLGSVGTTRLYRISNQPR